MSNAPKFQAYKSKKNGKWFWRVVAANGKKIMTGNEAFERRPTEKQMAMLLRNLSKAVYEYKK